MLTEVDKRKVQICVYILFSVVAYFFLTYVWLVFENVGFVQGYIDKSVLLKKVIHYLTICLKSTWIQDATKNTVGF